MSLSRIKIKRNGIIKKGKKKKKKNKEIKETEKNLKTDNVKTHGRLSSRSHYPRFNHRIPKTHLPRYRTIQRVRLSIVVDSIVL